MKLYGIKNCDTVKKARSWLSEHKLDVPFHDFKTDGISAIQLERWEKALGWEKLVNQKGTTWRGLPETVKKSITDAAAAKRLMIENPSVIKRPILELAENVYVGFSPEAYNQLFSRR